MTAPWPWPDDRLDRRARIAHMYRARLAATDPAGCAELDDAMRSFGQAWIVDDLALDPESLLTTAEVAELADITADAVRMWVHRGHLTRSRTQGRTALYRWADVIAAQRTIATRYA